MHSEHCKQRPASTSSNLGRCGEVLATLSADQKRRTAQNSGLCALPLSCVR